MRITWAEIDLSAINHNLSVIRKAVNQVKIIAVVKANAYGHGILRIAREAVDSGVEYLGVGFLEEGILLRKKGFTNPILVLGGVLFRQVKRFLDHDLEITVSSLELAYAVNKVAQKYGTKARVHLKFDTGLNRIGISHHKAPLVFERLVPLKHLDIVGIYSHFSDADNPVGDFTRIQGRRFESIVKAGEVFSICPQYKHIACSGAILQHPDTFYNMIRAGLAMYGLYPSDRFPRKLDLKPALTFKSRIVFMKTINEGEPIGYGRTHYTQNRTRIATIPVGYGDGYNRKLSNNGFVLIKGRRYPIVGTVCMDQIMVDIGLEANIHVGDEVVLYGRQGSEMIPVEEIAFRIGTIPYEVVCCLTRRVPRVYIRSGR
ncbi:alanine racemase [bacterium]|nr:alanine racemase [candidate division CSSED10-310 bacterium]